jgi:hypothetical protein
MRLTPGLIYVGMPGACIIKKFKAIIISVEKKRKLVWLLKQVKTD